MTDPLSLGLGAISATKAAFDLTKAFSDIRDATKVQALKFELMSLLLEAQEAQAALVSEKRALEERLRQLENWEGEKARYQPETIGSNGSLCFGLKTDSNAPEAAHKLCANCFEHGLKRHLQPHAIPEGRSRVLMCRECGDQILISGVHDTRTVNARKPPTKATFGRQIGTF